MAGKVSEGVPGTLIVPGNCPLAVSWGQLEQGGAEGQPLLALGPPSRSAVGHCRLRSSAGAVQAFLFLGVNSFKVGTVTKVPRPAWVSCGLALALGMPT